MATPMFTRPSATFAALLTGLLAVISLAVPLPFGPPWIDGQAIETPVAACLRLTDGFNSRETFAPPVVALLREPSPGLHGWYVARLTATHRVPNSGEWRVIGGDSLEIRWHHSPSIRLRVQGGKVGGIVQPAGVAPLFLMVLERLRPVSGVAGDCAAS